MLTKKEIDLLLEFLSWQIEDAEEEENETYLDELQEIQMKLKLMKEMTDKKNDIESLKTENEMLKKVLSEIKDFAKKIIEIEIEKEVK